MKCISGIYSDVGIEKKVNQDAALVRQAATKRGKVLFAVVCDGMGGLEQGEVASATVIAGMSDWFEQVFPKMLGHDFAPEIIEKSLREEIKRLNNCINIYGREKGISLGTTLVSLLLIGDYYYVCNVGDSRIYYLKDGIEQMTHDQSYIQKEIDLGRITVEEAENSPKRNMLLQCIGASTEVVPDFYRGEYRKPASFLLCSDGFRHVITSQEMWEAFRPELLDGEDSIKERIRKLIETAKRRQERDNITAVLVCTKEEKPC
ncbi:MAG: protein phosphatase 2C domain-containing protein [Bacteroidales bacterium]|nr:protein phosphatase 2C domain-containing protein [Clostridium sp.]MCM1204249.1 protein phosphatase 2C domain-containing protein [Bacteroidales bacterium]